MYELEYALLDKPIVIYTDNTGAIALAKNPSYIRSSVRSKISYLASYIAKACAMYLDSVDDNII
jgi:hypothetical protein